MSQTTAKRRILLIVIAMLLLPAVVMAAIDSWTAPGFQVDLYEIDESNAPEVTYKYAITDTAAGGNAMSHWSLGLEQCAKELVSPGLGNYTTPIDGTVCGDGLDYPACESANYRVELGRDPTTGVTGIKFEGDTLAYPNTHLFHITVSGETARGEIPIAIKPGANVFTGTITGPICGPSAVSLSNASVASSGNTAFIAIAALTMLMGVATVGVWRKHGK